MATHDSDPSQMNPFRELTKTFEQFKVPGMDMSAFAEARRHDVEAMVAANQSAFEALQALARTQTEMLTQTMQAMQSSAQSMMSGGASGGGDAAEHTDAAQKAWHKMLGDMKDLADKVRKTQSEAMVGMGERAAKGMKDMQAMTRTK